MPLARIIGPFNPPTEWLTERLRALGYTVETVLPDVTVKEPADLEIRLENCELEEALARADVFARDFAEGQIFLAPGVLPETALVPEPQPGLLARVARWWRGWLRRTTKPSPVPQPRPQAPVEPAGPAFEPLHAERTEPATPSAPTVSSPPEVVIPTALDPAQAAGVSPPAVNGAAAIRADERSRWQSVLRRHEESRQAELARRAEEARQREQQRVAREAEIGRRNREAEAEVLRIAKEVERSASSTLASAAASPQPLPPPETGPVRIPFQALSEFEGSPREAALMANPPAAELPAQEPHSGPRPDGTSARPEPARAPVPPIVPPRRPPARRVLPAMPRPRTLGGKRLSQRAREWRVAVVTASVATVLLIGAWSLVTNPRPASPLTSRELQQSNQIKQDVPFGPVQITNQRGAAISPPGARKAPAGVAGQRKPAPWRQAASPRRKSKGTSPRRSANYAARQEENEVVVRHFVAARPQTDPAQAKAGVRHISDLN